MAEKKSELKRDVNLVDGIASNIAGMIGTGIFISPKGVTQNAGSVGLSLLIWSIGGFMNLLLAISYAEIAIIYPYAGGDAMYLSKAMSPVVGFCTIWSRVLADGAGPAFLARLGAMYLLQTLFPQCQAPKLMVTLLSTWLLACGFILNVRGVKWAAKLNSVIMMFKFTALGIITVGGLVKLAQGSGVDNFSNSFKGSNWNAGSIGLAFYASFFTYGGWDAVTPLMEELKNPLVNITRAQVVSVLATILLYVMANIGYFSVMTVPELLSSDTVALTWATKVLGSSAWVITILIAISASGSVINAYITTSRATFSAGRREFPDIFRMIHYQYKTPVFSLSFLFVLSVLYLLWEELSSLMNYMTILSHLRISLIILSVLYLRFKQPNAYRPFKLNIVIIAVNLLLIVSLMAITLWQSPITAVGLAVFLSGVPIYGLILAARSSTPFKEHSRISSCFGYITSRLQMFLLVEPAQDEHDSDVAITNKRAP